MEDDPVGSVLLSCVSDFVSGVLPTVTYHQYEVERLLLLGRDTYGQTDRVDAFLKHRQHEPVLKDVWSIVDWIGLGKRDYGRITARFHAYLQFRWDSRLLDALMWMVKRPHPSDYFTVRMDEWLLERGFSSWSGYRISASTAWLFRLERRLVDAIGESSLLVPIEDEYLSVCGAPETLQRVLARLDQAPHSP